MSFKFFKTDFHGDRNIGLYGFATDKYCLLGFQPEQKVLKKMADALSVPIHHAFLAGTQFLGIFAAGNSHGIVTTKLIEKHELARLNELGVKVLVIETKETAIGNLVLCNDKGCLISKKLEKFKKEISETLNVDVEVANLAGLEVIGSAGLATNRGCLCNPNSFEDELEKVERVLKVPVDVTTVSAGTPFPKAGLLSNSHGAVISDMSTGPELGRISEILAEEGF